VLLVIGGLVYTLGVVFHVNDRLQFSRSIWHGHVLAGAGLQWAAILIGTVLPMTR
jgi:hemolysin III